MLRNPVFKFLQTSFIALLILAFTVSTAGAKPAQVSTGWMPFTGSLYDFQTESLINLNGLVHVVAHWKSKSSGETEVSISANLPADKVTVTTDTSIPYTASGGGESSFLFPTDPTYPTDPLRFILSSFRLIAHDGALPPNPILPPNPVKPFGMQFDLVFSAPGVLDFDASTVQVVELIDVGED